MQSDKILIFGDSFVKIFTSCLNKDVIVYKYKGATIKGLTKPENKNRQDIEKKIAQYQGKIKGLVFNFGQVDYNFSRYYKLVRSEEFEQEEIVSKYFEWINGLKVHNKLVLAIYPSPLSSQSICGALLKYMILTRQQINEHKQKIMLEFKNHSVRHLKWRELFKEQQDRYKTMKVIDVTNKIINKQYEVKKDYRDFNAFNIHLLWKKLIIDLQTKLQKYFQLKIDHKTLVEKEKKYEQEKKLRMKKNFTKFDI